MAVRTNAIPCACVRSLLSWNPHATPHAPGINDVKNVYQFLTIGAGFNPANIRVLTDDQTDPSKMPNRANIEAGMKWLAEGAAPGDSLFFHYSGHGGQERDPTFLEDDGMVRVHTSAQCRRDSSAPRDCLRVFAAERDHLPL